MKRKIFGTILISLGVILLTGALGLGGYYLWVQERAGDHAQRAMEALLLQIPTTPSASVPDTTPSDNTPLSPQDPEVLIPEEKPDPLHPMPTIQIDGVSYIGYVQIPGLGLSLPVIEESTPENLNIAPCRFFGSVYQNDLVIGGHRYSRHFANINTLGYGAPITFTDTQGNVYTYEVTECEVIEAYEAEYLCSGDWDLTLYTCTPGGRSRVAVRCVRIP